MDSSISKGSDMPCVQVSDLVIGSVFLCPVFGVFQLESIDDYNCFGLAAIGGARFRFGRDELVKSIALSEPFTSLSKCSINDQLRIGAQHYSVTVQTSLNTGAVMSLLKLDGITLNVNAQALA